MNAFDISGKRTIITGAAKGIGFGIAKRFVEHGANVLLVDRDEAALRAATARLEVAAGKVHGLALDVGADDAGSRIVTAAFERFGGIDVLVNDAGIFPTSPALEMTPELFDRVIRVNLRGLVFICQAVGRELARQKKGGKIVNIGSIDSLHPSMIGLAAYDSSKGGVLMFTKSLALEMARHQVQVNLIAPGGITTEGTTGNLEGMTAEQTQAFLRRFVETKVPLGRMGVPDDIAKAAVFLASSASDYITGTTIVVDGGTLLT
ncbi:MAG TPA: SDR family oxidoreductase [Polyangiaceae bacterium]|nr:SDR family oxidoreductase [Polyangiaceae bacterium]